MGFTKFNANSSNNRRCWKNSNVYSEFGSKVGVLLRLAYNLSNALFRVFIQVVIQPKLGGISVMPVDLSL